MSDLPDELPVGDPAGPGEGAPADPAPPSVPAEFLVTPDALAPAPEPEPAIAPAREPAPEPASGSVTAPAAGDDPDHHLSGRQKVVAAVLTVIILVAGVGLFAVMAKMRPAPKRQASLATFTAVRVQTIAQTDLQESLTGYGRARAVRSSDVAATVGGTVEWVAPECEAGAWVDAGQVLLKLDPREYAAAVESARARAAQAAAALERAKVDAASVAERLTVATEELALAQQEFDRLQNLPDAVTRSQLDAQRLQVSMRRRALLQLQRESDTAGPSIAAATAELAAAKAAEGRAQLDLDRAQVRAPFAGEIGERMVHQGQRVAPGAPLFQLTDASRIEVPVAIAARHYGEVRPGAKLVLRGASDGPALWEGTVARIAPRIDDRDRTFFVYAEIATPAPAEGGRITPTVAPGAFVIGEVEGPLHAGAIAVPRSAFINDRAYVAMPATVVAYVASDAPARTPETRAAQAEQLKGIAAKLATVMASVPGCGTVDPPEGSGVMKVSAAYTGSDGWEATAERVRAAVRTGNVLAADITITVGVEATVVERRPEVARRLPEVALIGRGLAPGELLVVTNLEQVAGGGRVRLVGDQPEQVHLPAAPAAKAPDATASAGGEGKQ